MSSLHWLWEVYIVLLPICYSSLWCMMQWRQEGFWTQGHIKDQEVKTWTRCELATVVRERWTRREPVWFLVWATSSPLSPPAHVVDSRWWTTEGQDTNGIKSVLLPNTNTIVPRMLFTEPFCIYYYMAFTSKNCAELL